MPAPLRAKLSREQEETLKELQKANLVPDRTRNRARMLMLNAQGRNVPEIAQIFNCHEHTVRAAIQRWQEKGWTGCSLSKRQSRLATLWAPRPASARGRGAKAKWKAEDLEYIETCLNEEERTSNSIQLARKLREERAVNLSSDRFRKILKKRCDPQSRSPFGADRRETTGRRSPDRGRLTRVVFLQRCE